MGLLSNHLRRPWDVGSAGRLTRSRADRQREGERGDHQKNPPICREEFWNKYGFTRKDIGGGGMGKSKNVEESKDHRVK